MTTSGQVASGSKENNGHGSDGNYWRFGAMIATSTTAMFLLMYAHTYQLSHVQWSETRFYMALVMGAAMAGIMLGFMIGMYRNRKLNVAIFVGSLVVLAASIVLVRSQVTVDDDSYMSAMIPHHSIAILTSERAGTEDVRVRELADRIIEAQRREIQEMEWLISDIAKNGVAATRAEAEKRSVPDFEGSS